MDRLKDIGEFGSGKTASDLHSNMDRLKGATWKYKCILELIYIPIWID